MSVIAIFGPMKSGKTLALIARSEPYEAAEKKVLYIHPKLNVRDEQIQSRTGLVRNAQKVDKVSEIDVSKYDVIVIDEFHMFTPEDVDFIRKHRDSKEFIVAGLDIDYKADLMESVAALYRIEPDEMIRLTAVCDNCKALDARFTSVTDQQGKAIPRSSDSVLPDDGTLQYGVLCYRCFDNF